MSSVVLSNSRVCAFYAAHPHLNPDDLNAQLIDLLEKNAAFTSTPQLSNHFQISELRRLQTQFKDTIHSVQKNILTTFVSAKRDFTNEFNSILSVESDRVHTEFVRINRQFTTAVHAAIFHSISERTFAHKYPAIYDKLTQLSKQFTRIMQSNIDTVMAKQPTSSDSLLGDYIANFDVNAGHMIQNTQAILSDFVSTKDIAISAQIAALSQNAEGAAAGYTKLQYELTELIQTVSQSVDSLEQFVTRIYPSATNISTDREGYVLLQRDHKPTILVSASCVRDRNVSVEETSAFIKSSLAYNCHGVLVSHHTGISCKPNFHIDIQNHHIIVYIHHAQYNPEKIQLAVDMIDSISAKLAEFIVTPEYRESIPRETLDDINREYQTFIAQKESFALTMKESFRKMSAQFDEFQFPSLDKFLSTRYSSSKKQGYTCDICGIFTVGTLKGLAAHKRGCNRKHGLLVPTPIPTHKLEEIMV